MIGQHSRMKAGLFGSIIRTPRRPHGGEARCARRRTTSSSTSGIKRALARPAGDQPLLRRPAAGGDRPRAGVGPEGAAARRADGRHEPAGVRRADGLHAQAARRARDHDPADRARHEGRSWASPSTSPCSTTARRSPRAARPRCAANPRVIEAYLGKAAAEEGNVADGVPRSRRHPDLLRQHPGAQGHLADVEEGECVTLIGSNGAGKSTTLRSISGLTPPRTGSIKLAGEEISHAAAAGDRAGSGICQSPEGRKCFQRMTVRENLELGAFLRRDSEGIVKDLERVFELFPRLEEREAQKAGTMSGGEQQMLAIGRAHDGPAEAAAARRAVDGHLADPHRAHLRDDRGDQPAGHDDPAGRAERELRARRLQARLRAGDRQGRDDRRSDALRTNPEVQKAYLGT